MYGSIILKLLLKVKYEDVDRFLLTRDRKSGGLLSKWQWTLGFRKMRGISWV